MRRMFGLLNQLALVLCAVNFSLGKQYVVRPADRKASDACASTGEALSELLGPRNVQVSGSVILRVTQFWLVEADESQLLLLKKIEGVRLRNPIGGPEGNLRMC